MSDDHRELRRRLELLQVLLADLDAKQASGVDAVMARYRALVDRALADHSALSTADLEALANAFWLLDLRHTSPGRVTVSAAKRRWRDLRQRAAVVAAEAMADLLDVLHEKPGLAREFEPLSPTNSDRVWLHVVRVAWACTTFERHADPTAEPDVLPRLRKAIRGHAAPLKRSHTGRHETLAIAVLQDVLGSGVSRTTLHRWRKAHPSPPSLPSLRPICTVCARLDSSAVCETCCRCGDCGHLEGCPESCSTQ